MFISNLANLLFIALIVMIALIAMFYFLTQPPNLKSTGSCPVCKKWVTLEKLDEKTLGVFRKGESRQSNPFTIKLGGDDVKMVWYEKFEMEYRCPNCGHEWTSTEIRRV